MPASITARAASSTKGNSANGRHRVSPAARICPCVGSAGTRLGEQQARHGVVAGLVEQGAVAAQRRRGDDSPQLAQAALAALGVDALAEPERRVAGLFDKVVAMLAKSREADSAIERVG
jgi:hypothetical protein